METATEPKPPKKTGGDIYLVTHLPMSKDEPGDEPSTEDEDPGSPIFVPLTTLGGVKVPKFDSIVQADRFMRKHLTPEDGSVGVVRSWPPYRTASAASYNLELAI